MLFYISIVVYEKKAYERLNICNYNIPVFFCETLIKINKSLTLPFLKGAARRNGLCVGSYGRAHVRSQWPWAAPRCLRRRRVSGLGLRMRFEAGDCGGSFMIIICP